MAFHAKCDCTKRKIEEYMLDKVFIILEKRMEWMIETDEKTDKWRKADRRDLRECMERSV